ncbi:MAG: Lrp/AsnC ligand binding domain-containing protein [Candidatus Bathyarchaeota archaeon]|jgi:DNA-binding Lrp family transcriptional regulator|nr:Lrp/AsnC ligand binding domain-containing protein [Candidatus Bathyarchaeota archaeon]MDH5664499.1 Lrp/AsnC ligand binding domain-containing protein [Candidatus Bathyarchaeota archaeon]
METGYVLFSLKPGTKKDFIKKVKDIKAVKEARLVIGICDAIAKIEAESIEELEKIYFNEIDKIADIMNSRLHIVACPRTRK